MKTGKVISFAMMIITLAAVSVFSIYSFWDKNTVSEKENRTLAGKPEVSVSSWFDGSFMTELDAYLNDHVLLRSEIIKNASDFESLLRKDQSIKVFKSDSDRQDIGSDALVLEDRILALYIYNQDYLESIINASNELFDMMPENVNKYMMLTPTRIEFEDEEYKKYSDSQIESIYGIYSCINKDVTLVDSYSLIEQAKDVVGIDRIFFKTDHHWTAHGASFGANALLAVMGKELVLPDRYNEVDMGDFLGYLAVMHSANVSDMKAEKFTYYECADNIYEYAYGVEGADITESIYEPVLDAERAGYYTFIERSYQYVVIEGGDKEGGNLLMINDSYGNAMVPWMAEQYNTIVMVDPRVFTGGKEAFMALIDDYEIDSFVISLAGLVCGSSFGGEMEKLCN